MRDILEYNALPLYHGDGKGGQRYETASESFGCACRDRPNTRDVDLLRRSPMFRVDIRAGRDAADRTRRVRVLCRFG